MKHVDTADIVDTSAPLIENGVGVKENPMKSVSAELTATAAAADQPTSRQSRDFQS